jgi:hypothetical protein
VTSLPLDVFWFGHLKTSTSRGEVPFMLENPCYSRAQINAKCSFKNTYLKQQYFRKEALLISFTQRQINGKCRTLIRLTHDADEPAVGSDKMMSDR